MSEQQICQENVNSFVEVYPQPAATTKEGPTETQIWGTPWTEEQFVEQMVKFGHPNTVKSGLPEVLQAAIDFHQASTCQERVEFRAAKLGFWLRRLVELRGDETKLKQSMDVEVAQVVNGKNLLLWEDVACS